MHLRTLLPVGIALGLFSAGLVIYSGGTGGRSHVPTLQQEAAETRTARLLGPAGTSADGRASIAASVPEAFPGSERSLLELLASLAGIEEHLLTSALTSGLDGTIAGPEELEDAVAEILIKPDHVLQVIGLLESGDLRGGRRGDSFEWSRFDDLTRLEYGAIRALSWAMTGYNDPGDGANPFFGLTCGHEVVLNVVLALTRMEGSAQEYLLNCVGEARYQATGLPILDASYLGDLLALRGAFIDHEELFWRLLSIIKETMAPEEIRALDAVAADPNNPTAVSGQIAALFQAGEHDLAMQVARQTFALASSDEVKKAVTAAVVTRARETDAAAFMVERTHDTKRWAGLWLSLGRREYGSEALNASYTGLFGKAMGGADSSTNERARELCLTGMVDANEDRLIEVFNQESSPRIRGQALLTMTFRTDYASSQDHLDLLEKGIDNSDVDVMKGVSVAYTLTAKAPQDSVLRENGIGVLEKIRDSSESERAREYASRWLDELND